MKVIPPNFGYVEEGIFRCGAPEPRHYGFLTSLGLRTCVLLTDTHDGAFVHWLQESGVTIFCPLSNEAQARASFRGGAPTYSNSVNAAENRSFPQPQQPQPALGRSGVAGGSGSAQVGMYNSTRDESRDDLFSRGSRTRQPPSPGETSNANANVLHTRHDGAEAEGGADGSDNHADDGGIQWNVSGSGSPYSATISPLAKSNAVRFLRENAMEGQVSTKFSPVLIQEPLYFSGSVARSSNGAGGGGTCAADGAYQFISAPSYEGKLHGLMTLSEAVVVSILHILLDPQYYPLLITCSKGRYRSGIVCGCLRKLQGWNLVSILEEYRRFAGDKSRADNEEFIELFDEELVNLALSDGRRPTILYNL